jgi:hypothetical protein
MIITVKAQALIKQPLRGPVGGNNPYGCKGKPKENTMNINNDSVQHPTGTFHAAGYRRLISKVVRRSHVDCRQPRIRSTLWGPYMRESLVVENLIATNPRIKYPEIVHRMIKF